MTPEVVGASWGSIEQAASPGLQPVEAAVVSRDSHSVRMGASMRASPEPALPSPGIPHSEDVNAADENWEAHDYRASDEPDPGVLPLPPLDGLIPGLLPANSSLESDLPLFGAIRPPSSVVAAADSAEPSSAADDITENSAPWLEEKLPADDTDLLVDPTADMALEDDWEAASDDRAERGTDDVAADWDVDVELPDFDPEARVDPWDFPAESIGTALRKARLKAAALATELTLSTPAEIRRATDYLVELYGEWRHAPSHQALMRLARQGLDLETLQAMADLRREWARRTDWWLYRYHGAPYQHEGCRLAMTWRLAHDGCCSRGEFPSDSMIDEDWLDEWYALRAGAPGYYSFAGFVAEKVESTEAAVLYDGLQLGPGDHHEGRSPGDHHSDLYRVVGHRREE